MTSPSSGLPGQVSPWTGPFWRIWAASTTSSLGDGIRLVALPLLAVSLTIDPVQIGMVAAAGSLPWLIVGLPAGALVDRWNRLRTMAIVNAARATVMAALALVIALGEARIWMLVLTAFLIGTGETFVDNAAQAVLPDLIPPERLDRANSRLYAGQVVSRQFLGQGVSGALFAATVALPFAVDAGAFLLAAVAVASVRASSPPPRPVAAGTGVLSDMREGLSWLAHHERALRRLLLVLAALGIASGAFWAVIALYSVENLHLSPAGFGLLLAVGAAGSLVGSLIAPAVRGRIGTFAALTLSVGVIAAASAGLALTTHGAIAAVLMVANGVGVLVFNVVTVSLRQQLTPARLQGRIAATFRLVALGGMSLGALTGGLLAAATSVATVFWVSAAVVGAGAITLSRRFGRAFAL